MAELTEAIENTIKNADGTINMEAYNKVLEILYQYNPNKHNPVGLVRWVDIDKVKANNYNPNAVAKIEMNLLFTSIKHDGYTQPVVTFYDKNKDEYIIVDGFHRYSTMKNSKYLRELNHNLLPVVVIDKDINDRRASTVRHNRARGSHSVEGMSDLVYQMLNDGWSDARICNELGMEADELIRLKYITGYAKLYENAEFNNAWTPALVKEEE
jgi:ParB-like chromosome segregation protein Spo0J